MLIATETVRTCIEDKDRTKGLRDVIAAGTSQYGMQTFDQSLYFLLQEGLITVEEALKRATNVGEFKLRLEGVMATPTWRRPTWTAACPSPRAAAAKPVARRPHPRSTLPLRAAHGHAPASDVKISLAR